MTLPHPPSSPSSPSSPSALPTDTTAVALTAHIHRAGYARLSGADIATWTGLDANGAAALAALATLWHDLPPDAHLKDGGRYRRRRHGSFVQDVGHATLAAVPHRPHWQPTTYNALHGGMLRAFEPLAAGLATSPAFLNLMQRLGEVFAAAAQPNAGEPTFDGHWFIEAHAFRIDTTGGGGRPRPEGAHRDGVSFVAVILIDRVNVLGGETRVFEADGPNGVRFTLTEPWSALLLDDARVVHESTPIQPAGPGGHRDTLVLTYRAGGFQDPPVDAVNPADIGDAAQITRGAHD